MTITNEINSKLLREFGLLMGGIFAVLFGLLLPWLLDAGFPVWPWVLAAVLWGLAIFFPMGLRAVYRGWMLVGHVLGWVNTRLILGILFYLVFMPMGLLMRLFGKDPMQRKMITDQQSYRVSSRQQEKNHMERPF